MILENSLERHEHGYARILIADYHKEYPLEVVGRARVQLVWDTFEISQISEALHGVDNESTIELFATNMFGPLERLYGQHYEVGMSLWIVQGSLSEIAGVFDRHAQNLMGGSSGDDDTYDYWPNAFEMLMEMASDLIAMGYYKNYIVSKVNAVVKSAIAINGPPNEWEAKEILTAVAALEATNPKEA